MSELGEIPIGELKRQIGIPQTFEEEIKSEQELKPAVNSLRSEALNFIRARNAEPWLVSAIEQKNHLDGIISSMRHIEGGQEYILNQLQTLKPDLAW